MTDDMGYIKDGDDFVFVHAGDEIVRTKEVAIGFTFDEDDTRGIAFTVHRHGSPEGVQKWVDKTQFGLHRSAFAKQLSFASDKKIIRSLSPRSIVSSQWDVDELNRLINTTGYLGRFLEVHGISLKAI